VEDLLVPAKVELKRVGVHQIKVGPSWMDSIVAFLKEGVLPPEKGKAEKIRRKAPRFWLSEE